MHSSELLRGLPGWLLRCLGMLVIVCTGEGSSVISAIRGGHGGSVLSSSDRHLGRLFDLLIFDLCRFFFVENPEEFGLPLAPLRSPLLLGRVSQSVIKLVQYSRRNNDFLFITLKTSQ